MRANASTSVSFPPSEAQSGNPEGNVTDKRYTIWLLVSRSRLRRVGNDNR